MLRKTRCGGKTGSFRESALKGSTIARRSVAIGEVYSSIDVMGGANDTGENGEKSIARIERDRVQNETLANEE